MTRYVRYTGIDPFDPTNATTPKGFTTYAKARLGCELPVGKQRAAWYQRLKEEMEIQNWGFKDLVQTVQYILAQQIQVRRIYGIFYHVDDAQRWAKNMVSHDLHAQVAAAMSVEQDEMWLRRLSLAKGKALERVLNEWRKQNGSEV